VTMMQTVTIETSSEKQLRGVLHLPPEGQGAGKAAAVLLPGRVGNRVGPHRILYDLARLLTESGLPVLRCDPSGVGYSDEDGESASMDCFIQDVQEMMNHLQQQLGAEDFLLGGICRGSRIALAASLDDPRAKWLMLLSCPRLHESSPQQKAARRRRRHLAEYARKFFSFHWLPRLFAGDLNFRLISQAIVRPLGTGSAHQGNLSSKAFSLDSLTARTIFIFGEKDPDYADWLTYYQNELHEKLDKIAFHTISEADHGFYAEHWHRAVRAAIEQWWASQLVAEVNE
jgi:pimeloyl-ACP methyl ester carboxylesterase